MRRRAPPSGRPRPWRARTAACSLAALTLAVPAAGTPEELADNGTDNGTDSSFGANSFTANSSAENSSDTGTATESSSTTVSSTTVSTVSTDCAVTSAPEHGDFGDCGDLLASNTSCQPACDSGYTAGGRLECIGGNLSVVECLPNPCTNVQAPDNGTLGNCPSLLESGAGCTPRCNDGFFLVGHSSCQLGNFTPGSCETTCPAGQAPARPTAQPAGRPAGSCAPCRIGTYKAEESIDESCEPCPGGYITLAKGSVSLEDCVLECPAHECCVATGSDDCGEAAACNASAGGECRDCPPNTFKGEVGPGACAPCPFGSTSSAPAQPSCICGEEYYARRTPGGALVVCLPCPRFSWVTGSQEGSAISDCVCDSGYIPDNCQTAAGCPSPATEGELKYCRLPYPCNLSDLYGDLNLTFEAPHDLTRGSCAAYDGENGSWLPDNEECRLSCLAGTAPQTTQFSFFSAVDTLVRCDDGTIIENIADGTWCSTASWEIPPVVFLGTVTLLAGVAGLCAEARQRRFEHNCVRALSLNTAGLGVRGEFRREAKEKAE